MKLDAWVAKHCPGARADTKTEFAVCCPMHREKKPSLYINKKSGLWKCHAGCGGGSAKVLADRLNLEVPEVDAVAPEAEEDAESRYVAEGDLKAAWARMWSKEGRDALKFLAARGIHKDVVKEFQLGMGEDLRIWIPVFDHTDKACNVRCYDWTKTQQAKYTNYKSGFGKAHIWPHGVIEANEEVIVLEGEMDCLLAHAMGLRNAITSTGGASSWTDAWTRALAGKKVLICYDIDDAGRAGASALLARLRVFAASVATVVLPISEPANGDFTDFVRSVKFSRGAVHQLFGSHRATAAKAADRVRFGALAHTAPSHTSTLALRAVVSGKDLTPFNVPAIAEVLCVPDAKSKVCGTCPLRAMGGQAKVPIPVTSKVTLQSVLAADRAVDLAVRDFLCIPNRCPGAQVSIPETVPLWDVRLSPDVDSGEEEGAEGARRAFSMVEMNTNQPYDLEVASVSDPKTQYSLLHILKSTTSTTALDAWRTDGKESLLSLWEPGASKAGPKPGRAAR